jgi:uncharacterized protein (DUF58 family)
MILFWRERVTPFGHVLAGLWLFAVFLESLPQVSGIWPLLLLFTAAWVTAFLRTLRPPAASLTLSPLPRVFAGDTFEIRATPCGAAPGTALGVWGDGRNWTCEEASAQDPFAVRGEARKRGVFPLQRVLCLESEPFCLMRARKVVPANGSLVVWPKPAPPEEAQDLLARAAQKNAHGITVGALGMQAGPDFVGIRPWRTGDSRRDLHQQAFARYGKPYTREYDTGARGLKLEFSTQGATEHSVSLCCALVLRLSREGRLAEFWIDGNEVPLGHAPQSHALDALAAIKLKD